jgi:DNA-binding NtrC family response regulator
MSRSNGAAVGGTTHRVLVVDDVEDMLDVCAETLRMLDGVEVVTELHASAAMARLQAEPFDLLVADIRMPSLDGVELLRRAREHDPGLPVVMLTGHPDVEMAVECLRLGAADYITKPMNPDDLQARVLRCLRERRPGDEGALLRRHPVAAGSSYVDARRQAMAAFEREYLAEVLRRHGGDVRRAMAHAQVSRASLYRMLRASDLRASEFRSQGVGAVTRR